MDSVGFNSPGIPGTCDAETAAGGVNRVKKWVGIMYLVGLVQRSTGILRKNFEK